jgi:hypothetical protein
MACFYCHWPTPLLWGPWPAHKQGPALYFARDFTLDLRSSLPENTDFKGIGENEKNDEHVPCLKRREAREAAPLSGPKRISHASIACSRARRSANMPAELDTTIRAKQSAGAYFWPSRGGFGPPAGRFWGRPGRKKRRTTRTKPPPAHRPTHLHTRRYIPDVQDAEHIRDVLK